MHISECDFKSLGGRGGCPSESNKQIGGVRGRAVSIKNGGSMVCPFIGFLNSFIALRGPSHTCFTTNNRSIPTMPLPVRSKA